MSSNYHDPSANNKHHYKSHRENNAKNKFVIYVEKKQGSQSNLSNSQDSKPEPKQEEISKEEQKHKMDKAVELYEKFQEKSGDFSKNKDRKMNQNYPKKRSQRPDTNSRSISYHYSNDDRGVSHHQFFNEILRKSSSSKEISKEKILLEFERMDKNEINEKIKEFVKNYADCFSEEFFEPENHFEVKYNIKDIFSKNVTTSTLPENHSMNRHMQYGNRNQEEQMPAWALLDVNDQSFKS